MIMPTFDASWSGSLRVVGDIERPDHYYLGPEDDCYFLGEYTPRESFGFSLTNQHIFNLKKSPTLRNTAQWPHKLRAIGAIARTFAANLGPGGNAGITFVPIPPSKAPGHPEYDDRMAQIARSIGANADGREVIVSATNREPIHVGQQRRDPDVLRDSLLVHEDLLRPAPQLVILLDDVLTTGCSFVTCKALLAKRLPGTKIIGTFVARRVIPNPFAPIEFDVL